MLTFSPVFPRSIRFSIEQVQESLERISAYRSYDPELTSQDRVPTASSMLGQWMKRSGGRSTSGATGLRHDRRDVRRVAAPYLLDVQRRCFQIGEQIQGQYFAPRILRMDEVIQ